MKNKTFFGLFSNINISKSNFFGDVIITFVSMIITAGISFVTQGVAARVFTTVGYGEYLTVVRISWAILPVVMLGMPVALVRYLGLYATQSAKVRVRYALITTIITSISFGLLLVLLVVTPLPWIKIVLGVSADLRYAIAWLLAGLIPYTLAYGFYRGSLLMLPAAILSILESTIFLVVLLIEPSSSPQTIIYLIGLIVMILSLVFLVAGILPLFFPRRVSVETMNNEKVSSYLSITKEVFQYGLPRVPGFLIVGMLFSIGTIFLARAGDLVGSASLNVGINVLTLASLITGPIALVLLPRGSNLVGQGKMADLSVLSKDILLSGIHLGILVFFQWLALGAFLLEIWLKFTAFELVLPVMIIGLSFPFYITYDITRNILDSLTHRPLNLINQTLSLAAFGVIYTLASWTRMRLSISVAIGLAGSLMVLGLLTGYRLTKELDFRFTPTDIWVCIKSFLTALVASLITGGMLKAVASFPPIWRLGLIAMLTLMLGLAYLAYLYSLQTSWLMRITGQSVVQRFISWISSWVVVKKL